VAELPHLKALVERHASKPFAVLGVNTDRSKDEFRARSREHGVTWRSAWQGSTQGPLPTLWGIQAYPTVFVLDAKHVIRAIGARGEALARVVDELLAEAERDQ
jgi:hypothetical protein